MRKRLKRLFPSHDRPRALFYDLGAYDGDTIREFLIRTGGRFKTITALEPDPKNCRKLLKKTEDFYPGLTGDKRFRLTEGGIWSEDGKMFFDDAAGRNSSLCSGGRIEVPVYSLDTLTYGHGCSFVKMDVEGAEREALLGARRTLNTLRPKLLFSAYHRAGDIFTLPVLLNMIVSGYRFYLRHQPYYPAWEVNFIALPD